MNNFNNNKIREEAHSNMSLISSIISLIMFTIFLFMHNNLSTNPASIIFCDNISLALCIISGIASAIMIFLLFKGKNTDITEYIIISIIISILFYFLHGVYIIRQDYMVWVSVAIIALYWAISLCYHSFFKDKIKPNFKLSLVFIISLIAYHRKTKSKIRQKLNVE